MSGFLRRHAPLLAGLVIGHLLGLVFMWTVANVEVINTSPALLQAEHRRDWVRLTALSYAADENLARAQARLDGLEREDVEAELTGLIEAYAAAGRPAETLRRLAVLADTLGAYTPAMLAYVGSTPVPPTPVPTQTSSPLPTPLLTPIPIRTAIPTDTPEPSPTAAASAISPLPTPTSETSGTPGSPTLLARLELAEREQLCQPDLAPHIEVTVQDERGRPIPGVEVWLMWSGGADRAITGLKPRRGEGYADFDAQANVSYALGVSELGMPLVNSLRIEPCPTEEEGEALMGSWRIVLAPRSAEETRER